MYGGKIKPRGQHTCYDRCVSEHVQARDEIDPEFGVRIDHGFVVKVDPLFGANINPGFR